MLADCSHQVSQKKKPRIGAGLRLKVSGESRSFFFGGWARRLETITAQWVGVRHAHVAASVRAGGGMPFKRRLCGPLDVIGRRTGTRGIGEPAGSSSGRGTG